MIIHLSTKKMATYLLIFLLIETANVSAYHPIIVGDAFRIEFYGDMLNDIKTDYHLEFLHNTVQAWIGYTPWAKYPGEWRNIQSLISLSHAYDIPVGVATGWHVGDSVDDPYKSEIGFLYYYRHLIPYSKKWRYPNGTISEDPYSVGLSRSFSGYLTIRILGEELGRRDFYGMMQPQNPYWRDFLLYWTRKGIDSGADAIFFDSPDAIFTFVWGGGWGCKDTWEGRSFIEHLKSKFTKTQLFEMGIKDIDNFCLKTYLKNKYRLKATYSNPIPFRERFLTSWPPESVEFDNNIEVLSDPVVKEALLYWYQSAISLVKNISVETKKYARDSGKTVFLTTNEYFSWIPHITLTPYMDAVYVEDSQFRPFPYQTNGLVCKLAGASSNFTKPVWVGEFILWFANPFEPDEPPADVSTLIKLRVAEIYSNPDCIMLVPFGTGSPNEGWPPHRLVDGPERKEVSKYYRFIANLRDLFENTRSYSNVALVVSLPTAIWQYFPALGIYDSDEYYDEIRGWARALEEMHIPYDVLFLGMDDILDTDSYRRLKNYKLLIAPGLSRISSRDLNEMEKFLRSGGRLITNNDFALYDEMNNKRNDKDRMDILNNRNVIIVDKVGKSYWDSLGERKPDSTLFNYIRTKVNYALETHRILYTNASKEVMITPLKKSGTDELILSLVNYNYHYDKIHDWTTPEKNIEIKLKIPKNYEILQVFSISPEEGRGYLKYTQHGSSVILNIDRLDTWKLVVIEPVRTGLPLNLNGVLYAV
ncbi:hypothetical protein JCM16138_00910 [Thermococcus atlanticus]